MKLEMKRMVVCQGISFLTHILVLSLILLPIFAVKYALAAMDETDISFKNIDLVQSFTLPVQIIKENDIKKENEIKVNDLVDKTSELDRDKVADEKGEFNRGQFEKDQIEEKSLTDLKDSFDQNLFNSGFEEENSNEKFQPRGDFSFGHNPNNNVDSYDSKKLLRPKKKGKKVVTVESSKISVSQDENDLPQATPIFGTSRRWEDKFIVKGAHDGENADLMKDQFNELHVVLDCPVAGKAMVIDSYGNMKNHIIDMDQKSFDNFTQSHSQYCFSRIYSYEKNDMGLVGHSIFMMAERNSAEDRVYRTVLILYKKSKPLCEEIIAKANSRLKKHGLTITDSSVIQIFVKFDGDRYTPGKHTYTYSIPYALIRKDSGVEKLMLDP